MHGRDEGVRLGVARSNRTNQATYDLLTPPPPHPRLEPPPRCTRVLRLPRRKSARSRQTRTWSGTAYVCFILRPLREHVPNTAHCPQSCASSRDPHIISYQGSDHASLRVSACIQVHFKGSKSSSQLCWINWFSRVMLRAAYRLHAQRGQPIAPG